MMASPATPRILLIGTADTKADELLFMRRCIEEGGGLVHALFTVALNDDVWPFQFFQSVLVHGEEAIAIMWVLAVWIRHPRYIRLA